MKNLMNMLMLSCKKATELIDKNYSVKLTIKEKIMLRMHTGMCEVCNRYQNQSALLNQLMLRHLSKTDSDVTIVKNESLKNKIISGL